MSRKPRRNFTTEQKVAILRRHFVDKVAISDLCSEYDLQPSAAINGPLPGGGFGPLAYTIAGNTGIRVYEVGPGKLVLRNDPNLLSDTTMYEEATLVKTSTLTQ